MKCSACGKSLHPRGLNYMKIETESTTYTTCIPCLRLAQHTLKTTKEKSPEMKSLLRTLNRVLLVN